MIVLMKTPPQNPLEVGYKCPNGFGFQVDWLDNKWYVSFNEFTSIHHYSTVTIDVKDFSSFVMLLKQAKTKFRQP